MYDPNDSYEDGDFTWERANDFEDWNEVEYYEDEDYYDVTMDEEYYDDSMDGDHASALASIGWGVDEDYGYEGGYDDY